MSELTWDQLFERFAAARSLDPKTVVGYRKHLHAFLTFSPVSNPLALTQEHLKAYHRHLSSSALKETTVVSKMRALTSLLRWAYHRDLLLLDPTHDLPIRKPRRHIPKLLTKADVLTLIEATEQHLRAFSRLRDRAILELLYGTGMRIGEVAALQLCDLDLADLALTIRVSKGRPRRAPFGSQVASTLAAYLEERVEVAQSGIQALFVAQNGTALGRGRLSQILEQYSRKTGIPASPHDFRRAFATHLLENGANIVEIKTLLGHVDINSTLFYVQIAPVELTRAFNQSHPRARRNR
jgi:site-specific recombinase XerD